MSGNFDLVQAEFIEDVPCVVSVGVWQYGASDLLTEGGSVAGIFSLVLEM